MSILVALIGAAFVVFVLLLALPVELSFRLRRVQGQSTMQGRVRALGGLVRLPVARSDAPRRKAPTRRSPDRPRRGPVPVPALLRERDLFARLGRLLRRLLHRIRIDELELRARLGLGDPADTGRAWAVVGPVAALLVALPCARVRIDPDFTAEVLEVDGSGRVRVVPLAVIAVLLAFAFAPANLATLFRLARSRP